MKHLQTEPNSLEVLVAKGKFKLDNVRYKKLKTAKWNEYHVY